MLQWDLMQVKGSHLSQTILQLLFHPSLPLQQLLKALQHHPARV
jgi:hypothetical protein